MKNKSISIKLLTKLVIFAQFHDMIDETWLDKEKTRYDVGWNSALAELEGRLKIKSMQTKPNLGKSKDKLGDDFTKFLESEGYIVKDCTPIDTKKLNQAHWNYPEETETLVISKGVQNETNR